MKAHVRSHDSLWKVQEYQHDSVSSRSPFLNLTMAFGTPVTLTGCLPNLEFYNKLLANWDEVPPTDWTPGWQTAYSEVLMPLFGLATEILRISFGYRRCFRQIVRMKTNAGLYPPTWLIFGSRSGRDGQTLISNKPPTVNEAYGTMLSKICT